MTETRFNSILRGCMEAFVILVTALLIAATLTPHVARGADAPDVLIANSPAMAPQTVWQRAGGLALALWADPIGKTVILFALAFGAALAFAWAVKKWKWSGAKGAVLDALALYAGKLEAQEVVALRAAQANGTLHAEAKAALDNLFAMARFAIKGTPAAWLVTAVGAIHPAYQSELENMALAEMGTILAKLPGGAAVAPLTPPKPKDA